MKKLSIVWFMLALLSILAAANICWAVEEDEDGNIRQSQPLALEGDDSVAPKPKVIIKERVVMKCAPGTIWSPKNKRCISEDGEAPPPPRYQAPAPRQQAEVAPKDPRYVYPGTKLRINMDKCLMEGETVICSVNFTNTIESRTGRDMKNVFISDEFGTTYKVRSWSCPCGGGCNVVEFHYGRQVKCVFDFPLVNPAATKLSMGMLVQANQGVDVVRFSSVPILK